MFKKLLAVYSVYTFHSMQTQQGLVVILAVALVNFFVGSFLGPRTDSSKARGFLGYEGTIIVNSIFQSAHVKYKIQFYIF